MLWNACDYAHFTHLGWLGMRWRQNLNPGLFILKAILCARSSLHSAGNYPWECLPSHLTNRGQSFLAYKMRRTLRFLLTQNLWSKITLAQESGNLVSSPLNVKNQSHDRGSHFAALPVHPFAIRGNDFVIAANEVADEGSLWHAVNTTQMNLFKIFSIRWAESHLLYKSRTLSMLSQLVNSGHEPRQSQKTGWLGETSPWPTNTCAFLYSRCSFSSQISRKFTPWTQRTSSFLNHSQLPWRSGLGEEHEGERRKQTARERQPCPSQLPTEAEAAWTPNTFFLSQLKAADRAWGLHEPSSLKFPRKIFLFLLQQYDTAPYVHESDPI